MLPNAHFLIAAPSSGSGKTTLTLGLLRALKNRGLRVQPFKCGPDYIDTLHHTTAAGTPSINLDTFMAAEQHVAEVYAQYAGSADVAVTEGVMGLFDGSDRMQGSSAAIAELLNSPVVLVINAKAMAYSVAPLLYGFKNFYKGINLVGAIFNFVSTESHYRFLKEACADVGVEALGYFPSNPAFAIPSRHLGLHISDETHYETIIQAIAEAIPKTIDIDRLLAITRAASSPIFDALSPQPNTSSIRISIARDEAFTFMYHQNIDVLSRFGEIIFFSPLHDAVLPQTDFLYLPGGYPELYGEALSQNVAMREFIRTYCQSGGLAYAECGGLMYLGQSITDAEGHSWPMVGVLDTTTSMLAPKITLGYRIIQWDELTLKGHEFHYSTLEERSVQSSVASVTNAKGVPVETKLYRMQNTVASYLHVYWGDKPEFIEQLLSARSVDKRYVTM
ncbi:cobyrinate a,c-diamide synthase [soil metagenome]